MRLARALLLVSAFAAGLAASDAAASSQFAFRTPGHAAYCRMGFSGGAWTRFLCFTPNDGFYVRMTGVLNSRRPVRVVKGYSRRFLHYRNRNIRLLPFGRTWFSSDAEIVTCRSRSTGLTCRHWRGHGWWLGRYRGYRIF